LDFEIPKLRHGTYFPDWLLVLIKLTVSAANQPIAS
jgi:hypothetical protein